MKENEKIFVAELISATRYNNITWFRADYGDDDCLMSFYTNFGSSTTSIVITKRRFFGFLCRYELIHHYKTDDRAYEDVVLCKSGRLLSRLFKVILPRVYNILKVEKDDIISTLLETLRAKNPAHKMSFEHTTEQ